jgi:hypothetical protein
VQSRGSLLEFIRLARLSRQAGCGDEQGFCDLSAERLKVSRVTIPNDPTRDQRLFSPESKQVKDQELILRFLAVEADWKDYKRPMNEFLNVFSETHREFAARGKKQMNAKFEKTNSAAYDALE